MNRVEVDVFHWRGLARQLAFVEVHHVEIVRVEQVEDVEADLESPEVLRDTGVKKRRGGRADTIVFDQRARPEKAHAQSRFPAIARQVGDTGVAYPAHGN